MRYLTHLFTIIILLLTLTHEVSAQLVVRDFLDVRPQTRYVCLSTDTAAFELYQRSDGFRWAKIDALEKIREHRRLRSLWKKRFYTRILLRGNGAPQTNRARQRWNLNRKIVRGFNKCGSLQTDKQNDVCSIVTEDPSSISTRVINGIPCTPGESSVVQLEINYRNNSAICSGTVITPFTVLTAAHCLEGRPQSVNIVTGVGSFETTEFISHPAFEDNPFVAFETFDVALVYSSIPLPTRKSQIVVKAPSAGETGIIAGYGLNEKGESEQLHAAPVIINRVLATGIETVFDGTINRHNTCFGDSGGPLFVIRGDNSRRTQQPRIAGIISNGQLQDCGEGDIARYTNVASAEVQNFIAENIR